MQMRGFTTTKDSTDTESTEKPKIEREAVRILQDFTTRDIFQCV